MTGQEVSMVSGPLSVPEVFPLARGTASVLDPAQPEDPLSLSLGSGSV